MRGAFALILMGGFGGSIGVLFLHPLYDGNKEIITYMLGQLSGFVGTALAFYFSTSKSSAEKSATIDRLTKGDE
jgi:hypothetical protein